MTTQPHAASAKILRFVPRARPASGGTALAAAQMRPADGQEPVLRGAWYHDDAIREDRDRKS
jgi:hypothetical protein